MKRIGLLLITLLVLLVACASNQTELAEQVGENEGQVGQIEPTTANELEAPAEEAAQDDPTQARGRDWKLGDTVDPAVTIIEYGDFQ